MTGSQQNNKKEKKLHQKVTIAGAWVIFGRILDSSVDFIRLIIICRLFADNTVALGLFGLASLSIAVIAQFSQSGFSATLIQRKDIPEDYYDSAWSMELLRSILLFGMVFATSPLLGNFLANPETPGITGSQISNVTRAIALSSIFMGLSNIRMVKFIRALDFKKQFILHSSGRIVNSAVTISVALCHVSVWALIAGHLAGNLTNCLTSYILAPKRPRFTFNIKIYKDLWAYSKWIVFSSILVFILNQGDDLFVGKILGFSALAYYRMAYKISNLPATEISHTISRTTVPAYAALQSDLPKLKDAYLKVLCLTSFISFLIAGLIFALSTQFTITLLSSKWSPIIPAMQTLSIYGLIRSLSSIISPALRAISQHHITTRVLTLRLIIMAIIIYPLCKSHGFNGAALAVVINFMVGYPIEQYIAIKKLNASLKETLKFITIPMVSAIIMIMSISYIEYLFNYGGIIPFITLSVAGIAIYLISTVLLSLFFRYNCKAIIVEQLNTLKNAKK
ncbi:MAG: lipopolysaccharide biosynthesis protein [Phycisphaerae bacterium]|nr:lipopolysaccharide biosynthesis protein [Phycisphaerae bacterium]